MLASLRISVTTTSYITTELSKLGKHKCLSQSRDDYDVNMFQIFVFTDNGTTIHEKLKEVTGQKTVPNVFIRGKHIGGADDTIKLHEEGKLMNLIVPPSENYTYDLVVIGGGSGGLACSKVMLWSHDFSQL